MYYIMTVKIMTNGVTLIFIFVYFPFLDGDVILATPYDAYCSQLILSCCNYVFTLSIISSIIGLTRQNELFKQ